MPEIHLRQSTSDNLQSTLDKPGFRYNSCGSFTKNKKKGKSFYKKEIQGIFIKTTQINQ